MIDDKDTILRHLNFICDQIAFCIKRTFNFNNPSPHYNSIYKEQSIYTLLRLASEVYTTIACDDAPFMSAIQQKTRDKVYELVLDYEAFRAEVNNFKELYRQIPRLFNNKDLTEWVGCYVCNPFESKEDK